MNKIRRTLVAAGVAAVAVLGTAGVASAQTTYDPSVRAEVLGTQQAAAVSSGTLPYTGSDSSLPLAEVGAGLLAAGGLAVVMVRRHQASAQS